MRSKTGLFRACGGQPPDPRDFSLCGYWQVGPRRTTEAQQIHSAETSEEPDGEAGTEAARTVAEQPPEREGLSDAGRLSAILGIRTFVLGEHIFGPVVRASDAIEHQTDEGDDGDIPPPSEVAAELISRPRGGIQRQRGGPEQQGEAGVENGLRFQIVENRRNRPVSTVRKAS